MSHYYKITVDKNDIYCSRTQLQDVFERITQEDEITIKVTPVSQKRYLHQKAIEEYQKGGFVEVDNLTTKFGETIIAINFGRKNDEYEIVRYIVVIGGYYELRVSTLNDTLGGDL